MSDGVLKEDHLVSPALTSCVNTQVGKGVTVMPFNNIFGSNLADGVFIGPFCEIGGTIIGKNSRIGSHTFLCPGVEIGEETFVGHGVMTTNDLYADVPTYENLAELRKIWKSHKTYIGNHVRIGSGAIILPVRIGDRAIIGAGAVVLRDVEPGGVVAGNPARMIRNIDPQHQWGFS